MKNVVQTVLITKHKGSEGYIWKLTLHLDHGETLTYNSDFDTFHAAAKAVQELSLSTEND